MGKLFNGNQARGLSPSETSQKNELSAICPIKSLDIKRFESSKGFVIREELFFKR